MSKAFSRFSLGYRFPPTGAALLRNTERTSNFKERFIGDAPGRPL
jgi:hypothetical protein